jgi:hypothetical protein
MFLVQRNQQYFLFASRLQSRRLAVILPTERVEKFRQGQAVRKVAREWPESALRRLLKTFIQNEPASIADFGTPRRGQTTPRPRISFTLRASDAGAILTLLRLPC